MNKTALASTGDRRSDRPESLPTRSPLRRRTRCWPNWVNDLVSGCGERPQIYWCRFYEAALLNSVEGYEHEDKVDEATARSPRQDQPVDQRFWMASNQGRARQGAWYCITKRRAWAPARHTAQGLYRDSTRGKPRNQGAELICHL